jgi:hypothetical protein
MECLDVGFHERSVLSARVLVVFNVHDATNVGPPRMHGASIVNVVASVTCIVPPITCGRMMIKACGSREHPTIQNLIGKPRVKHAKLASASATTLSTSVMMMTMMMVIIIEKLLKTVHSTEINENPTSA